MKDKYISEITKILKSQSLTVVIAIYNALSSILYKKWMNRGIFLDFLVLKCNYS